MQTKSEDYRDLLCLLEHQTGKAVLVTPDKADVQIWIPKSCLSHSTREMNEWENGDELTLHVAEWFLDKSGL